MTATSFDRSAAWLGPRAWRALHLVGGSICCCSSQYRSANEIPGMPLYALFLIPLAVVFALRMIAMASRERPSERPKQVGPGPRARSDT